MDAQLENRPPSRGHLLLIDGHNMVRSIYGAMPGEDDEQKARSAIKSTWGSMQRALKEHQPSHFLTIFDGSGKNWRHDLYPEYKAGRTPMSEPLKDAMETFKIQMNRTGLRNITASGFEAEDVISTISVRAIPRGFDVTTLSTDKDVAYLICKGVKVVNHFGTETRDDEWMAKKYKIKPIQMTDFLALCGDDTDGIPGVDKIAEKTAAKLLDQYKTLECILRVAKEDGIKGVVGKNLVEQADRAILSQQLARLREDVPIEIAPSALRLPDIPSALKAMRAAQAQWSLPEIQSATKGPRP